MLTAALLSLALMQQPAVSELGIKVNAAGLAELKDKVTGRRDAACRLNRQQVRLCVIGAGGEVYQFTDKGHPAHPSAYFLGYADAEDGARLEERGWTALSDDEKPEVAAFFAAARSAKIKPVALRD